MKQIKPSEDDLSALTDRQQQVLQFILDHAKEIVSYPTVREVAEHFKTSPSTIHQHIQALRAKGYLPAQSEN